MSEVIHKNDPLPLVQPTATIDAMLMAAVEKGASVEQLSQLFDLKLRVEANEARRAFVEAMSKFRAEAPTILKNAKGHNERMYASLDNTTRTINPLLAKNGLSYGWVTEQHDNITVHCDITHIQGHSQRTSLSAGPDTSGSKNSIQAIGSTVTYLQRYTLLSALGLATGIQDDDGITSDALSEVQAATIKRTLKELDDEGRPVDLKAFLGYLDPRATNVDELPVSAYEKAIRALNKKREQA